LDVTAELSGESGVRGAIDVSDGLSTDLIHLCKASGVGCEIDANAVDVSRALAAFCSARGFDPLDWIMCGGEDYALILSLSPRRAEGICRRIAAKTGRPVRVIGKFTEKKGHYAMVRRGKHRRFRASGWDHLRPRR
jgi:thiamine-monophosphate kinase